jgi:hypothetical protein
VPGTGDLQKANRLRIHHLEIVGSTERLDLRFDQKKRAHRYQSTCGLGIRMSTLLRSLSFTTCRKHLETLRTFGEAGFGEPHAIDRDSVAAKSRLHRVTSLEFTRHGRANGATQECNAREADTRPGKDVLNGKSNEQEVRTHTVPVRCSRWRGILRRNLS